MKITRSVYGILMVLFLILFLHSCQTNNNNEKQDLPYVVMLSLDGFRWDYPDMADTPYLDSIAEQGVKAACLVPCFPTKTFPNHYSIATGLYPDNHGIVNNSFYDRDMDAYYSIGNVSAVTNGDFYDGEPIWVTAEQQNVTTASFFWVGSEAPIMGIRPTYWKEYDHNVPFEYRIDTVIAWLNLPAKKRPHLILWYMDEPDSQGHASGPESIEVKNTVEYLDGLVGEFMAKVSTLPHADKINIIITSDHGMGEVSSDRTVAITDHINQDWFDLIQGSNPVYCFMVKQEYAETALNALDAIDHVSAWNHDEIPERLHYGTNRRVLDIVAVADSSWSLRWNPPSSQYTGGTHGYDNANKDMHAIFYAIGPAFKSGYIHPGFDNIDIYSLITEILGLIPADVDGTLEHVQSLLKAE